MKDIQRKDIHLIARHSNLDEHSLQQVLEDKVYASSSDWQRFLKLLFLSLAIGFTVTGIIFFFAYNWADLPNAVKLILPQVLLIIGTLYIVLSKTPLAIKNIVLTGLSMLVGALFAVFGQIYQTGANAYDFFLGWTVFISIWVLLANYSPLWLLYSALLNTTFYFYSQQVVSYWSFTTIALLFFLLNILPLLVFLLLKKYKNELAVASWYTNILAIATGVFATTSIISLHENESTTLAIACLLLVAVSYYLGVLYARMTKSIFFLALMALSIIAIALYYFGIMINDFSAVLLLGIFSLAAFTLTIKLLLNLQKDWNNEK